MSVKDKVIGWLQKKERQQLQQDVSWRGIFMNKGYHSFFEGYTEVTHTENGHSKIERIYTGKFYTPAATPSAFALLRLMYVCCFIAAAAGFIYAGTRDAAFNRLWYCTLPQMLSVPCMFYTGFLIYEACTSGMRLRIYSYKQCHIKLPRWSLYSAITLALSGVTALAFSAFNAGARSFAGTALIYPGCSALMLVISLCEKRLSYDELRGENEDVSGVEIHFNR